ncbi:MAG: AmmeMemoRadiSam system radical SAM enzyme [Candidatus Marinimicrobia bacterium]|nr:AmmeMemoRadiSam system radical SAM enzyme [Candidatus Neomarinimicrobiota bacterium]
MANKVLDRRKFLKYTGAGIALTVSYTKLLPEKLLADLKEPYKKEARYYKKIEENIVQCQLCPRECFVSDGNRGYCDVRENQNGTYYTLVYGRLVAIHIDPIEKKPLFHFLPGTNALSVATAGCNVDCKFCQNWNIAQALPEEVPSKFVPPDQLVSLAVKYKSPTMAFTYTEPVVFTEYVYDCASFGKNHNVRSVMISNGYINKKPMQDLCGVLDAVKIDLKSFNDNFYKKIVRGTLKPVLDTLVTLKESNKWFEMVYLVIPTLNDKKEEIANMSKWILSNLGPDVPIHFTRFHPEYLLTNLPPTPVKTLEIAYNTAKDAGLNFVYIGNVPGHQAENTYCPNCNKLLIQRLGFSIKENNIVDGKCKFCGKDIPGVWK